MSEDLHNKIERIHSWYEDNGAWGAKTKLAQLWDWMTSRKDACKKNDGDIEELYEKMELKLDRSECNVKHEKLVRDIEKMLDERDKRSQGAAEQGKWFFEQIKWLVPTLWVIFLYLQMGGYIK